MRAKSLAVLLLLANITSAIDALSAEEAAGNGPPPALAPDQAPPIPKQGQLATPRSSDQVGFPVALTASVIPPASPLVPAVVALGEKLFFDGRLSGDGSAPHATIRLAPSPTEGQCQSAFMAEPVSATPQPC
jgi:cytochrome c peroxidase